MVRETVKALLTSWNLKNCDEQCKIFYITVLSAVPVISQ
jgi:hypothetical protein